MSSITLNNNLSVQSPASIKQLEIILRHSRLEESFWEAAPNRRKRLAQLDQIITTHGQKAIDWGQIAQTLTLQACICSISVGLLWSAHNLVKDLPTASMVLIGNMIGFNISHWLDCVRTLLHKEHIGDHKAYARVHTALQKQSFLVSRALPPGLQSSLQNLDVHIARRLRFHDTNHIQQLFEYRQGLLLSIPSIPKPIPAYELLKGQLNQQPKSQQKNLKTWLMRAKAISTHKREPHAPLWFNTKESLAGREWLHNLAEAMHLACIVLGVNDFTEENIWGPKPGSLETEPALAKKRALVGGLAYQMIEIGYLNPVVIIEDIHAIQSNAQKNKIFEQLLRLNIKKLPLHALGPDIFLDISKLNIVVIQVNPSNSGKARID